MIHGTEDNTKRNLGATEKNTIQPATKNVISRRKTFYERTRKKRKTRRSRRKRKRSKEGFDHE